MFQIKTSENVSEFTCASQTYPAVPKVKRKLETMLKAKEKRLLDNKSQQLETMARRGNHMAQTVIGISNELHVQSVGNIQKRLETFDTENYQTFKDEIVNKKSKSFFLTNLNTLANLGRSQSKDES